MIRVGREVRLIEGLSETLLGCLDGFIVLTDGVVVIPPVPPTCDGLVLKEG